MQQFNTLFFASNKIFLFNTLLSFGKASFAIPMCLWISVSYFLSSVKTLPPRYLNSCTWLILESLICNLHVGLFPLLTTMNSSFFFQLMFNLFFLLSFTTFCRSFCSFLSVFYQHYVICISLDCCCQ